MMIIIIISCATVLIIHCSITNNVAIHSHIFKDGNIGVQLAVGDPSFHETVAGLELQLPSVKNLWNIKHGLRFCARLWKNYWRHQRKQRCWTSFVALVLKGYNFQRFVQLAASVCLFVCLCLLEYCRGEIRVVSICRSVLLFTLFLLYNNNYYCYYNYNHCSCCCYYYYYGTRQYSWLTHCATSQKVMGSIPNGVYRIFHSLNPSGYFGGLGFKPGVNDLMSTIKTQGLLVFSYDL